MAELRRSNGALEEFAHMASHDLREPLRMVTSYTKLLQQGYGDQFDDDAREFIDFAVDGARRMESLIEGLLMLSRVTARGGDRIPTDASSAFDDALENLKASIEESSATVTSDALPAVIGDHAQLVMLFQNLVGNAIKFHGESSPRVHVSAEHTDNYWRFTVRDNGIGMEQQSDERIFLVFQRLHTREDYPGTGIGLALCKRIVERHGGEIGLESTPGEGSSFQFTLPRVD